MTEFAIAQWQSELIRIIKDNAKNLDSGNPGQIVNFVLDAVSSAESAGSFIDQPAGLDVRMYAQQVLATNSVGGIHDPNRTVDLGDSYTFILEYISEKGPDGLAIRNSSGGFDAPLSGVDDFTYLFLLGAWATNTSSSIGNDFGLIARDYNDTQYEIRFGGELGALTQQASDAIAFATAEDVELSGGIRTIYDLGDEDGSASDRVLWNGHGSRTIEGGITRGVDFGGWAGTPF